MNGHTDLVDDVRGVMASTFGVDERELPEDVSHDNYDRWTSLYHVTLMLALEDEFNTSFSMDEMPEMTSLSKIVAVLREHGRN